PHVVMGLQGAQADEPVSLSRRQPEPGANLGVRLESTGMEIEELMIGAIPAGLWLEAPHPGDLRNEDLPVERITGRRDQRHDVGVVVVEAYRDTSWKDRRDASASVLGDPYVYVVAKRVVEALEDIDEQLPG